jgi:cell wall-associated NlpC family hydrolase
MPLPDRAAIIATARSHLNVRWRHQGRSREHGIDCVGLLICVGRDTGYCAPDFDITGYARHPELGWLERELGTYLQPGAAGDPGDVMLFAYSGEPSHVGIVSDAGLIHCYGPWQPRRCVEHGMDEHWRARRRGCYAFKDLTWQR